MERGRALRWVAGDEALIASRRSPFEKVRDHRWSRALARYPVGKVLAVSAVSSFVPV